MEALTAEEGRLALLLARTTLENCIGGAEHPLPCLTPVFSQKRGVFVTLTRNGELRGCIGFPYPMLTLGDAVPQAATAAALEDPRFPPVSGSELPSVHIEVTVLSVPQPLAVPPGERPGAIEVGRHGLIVRGHGRSGLLLPQVATEYCWDARTFLDHTCMKAGLRSGCWCDNSVDIFTFEGQIFDE
ncbi:uncharacterized protein (TIGR00296 family) [Methanolinea mesophila]|uniref:TIGR00296 family protein n=1 Tax=Methanolinea mesophila TaxID=547055 RepID=UPI001AE2434E|nr:TIGR00296 family protein [Methanolinea mesophila]MBP1927851.1 uncharacterized protein (TIGR00296 family) [Methanolinea mesophila]